MGLPLGRELARLGHVVYGVRRSPDAGTELKAAGLQPLVADITRPEDLARLPAPFDWVVNCVSSSHGGLMEYQEVYLEGTRRLLEWLAAVPPAKFVYTSSTSVYGQDDGSLVKEDSPTEPESETSRVLVETEKLLLDAARERKFPAVILRMAGIYGPERGHYFKLFLKNEARIEGHGGRFLNMIHQDDVVGCLLAALKHGRPGEVYNAVDDEPVAQIHFLRWLAEALGKWMPPSAPVDEADRRKRGLTNKRVSNRKLKMELGYQFRYPTFRDGYCAEIKRLEQADQLDLEPEPR